MSHQIGQHWADAALKYSQLGARKCRGILSALKVNCALQDFEPWLKYYRIVWSCRAKFVVGFNYVG